MELASTVNETWKYFVAGSFFGFFLFFLVALQTNPYSSLLSVHNVVLGSTPFRETIAPNDMTKPLLDSFEPLHQSSVIPRKPFNQQSRPRPRPRPPPSVKPFEQQQQQPPSVVPQKRFEQPPPSPPSIIPLKPFEQASNNIEELNTNVKGVDKPVMKSVKMCNMFKGKWVYMAEESPSYDSIKCPFIEEKLSCLKNGRPDNEYEKWRWEASDCDIPLFNGKDMLERLRNKRVILAGDSLNRNMWESLACLLFTSIPSSSVEVQAQNSVYKVLKAKDYNCTVEFYWSPFLVEFVEKHVSGRRVLVLDKLSPNSLQWFGADVMVFNSGHWWLHGGKMKSWDWFELEGKLIKEMPIKEAYERAMKTWATWINKNIDPNKTSMFFRSLSAVHQNTEDWCYNSTQPIMNNSYVTPAQHTDLLVDVIKNLIKGMSKLQVKYLDISKLSQYRKDAHPSVYRSSQWRLLMKKYENNLPAYADCSHWCLPGLPDTWNRLLYASLFFV